MNGAEKAEETAKTEETVKIRGRVCKSEKRADYITWDEYFMGVAKLAAMRSKDPSTQVGACIVSSDNKILSMGYNGFPIGCSDDEFPWGKEHETDDPTMPSISIRLTAS